jgi:hypothetical protein
VFPGVDHRRNINVTNGEKLSPAIDKIFAESLNARLQEVERKAGGKGMKEIKFRTCC